MSPRKADPLALEYVVLGLIRLQPAHGYELYHSLHREAGIGMIWRIKPAQLYALLDKLEDFGWLKSEIQIGEGLVQRKQYQVTPLGEKTYHNWLNTPVTTPHRLRQEFLARLFFILRDPEKSGFEIIPQQLKICNEWQARMQQQIAELNESQVYEREVFLFRLGQVEAMRQWLTDLQTSLVITSEKCKGEK